MHQGAAIDGAESTIHSIARVNRNHLGVYVCRAFNDMGFTNSLDLHLVHDMDAPVIVRTSPDLCVRVGDNVTLEVIAKGDPMPEYQWYIDGSAITDADGPSLVIHSFSEALQGSYCCQVYNAAGRASSRPINVAAVATLPAVSLTCGAVVQCRLGSGAAVAASATGVPFPTLQWYHDGVPVPGATAARHAIKAVDFDSLGEYVCRATNVAGAVDSAPCSMELAHEAPVIEWQPSFQKVHDGGEVLLKLVARGIPMPRCV